MAHRTEPNPELPALVHLDRARAAGMTKDQVRQRVRSGEWRRLARGWYLRTGAVDRVDPHEERRTMHRMAAIAAALRLRGATICGPSAALLHGLPLSWVPDDVHLIAAPGGWTGSRAGVCLHEWAWVDVARVQGSVSGLIAGDHALRMRMCGREHLGAAVLSMNGSHHLHRASSPVPLLDARRETPLESESAWYFAAGIPAPEWQVEIRDAKGFIGRVDCTWDDTRLVGEADGRWKYATAEAVYAEKRREDRIRATGRDVIRWGRTDLSRPDLAIRLAAKLGLPTLSVAGRGPW